ILAELEAHQREPGGTDADLIHQLGEMARKGGVQPVGLAPAPAEYTVGTLVPQTLERPLLPGEVSLDELERAFRDTLGPAPIAAVPQVKAEPRKAEHDKSQNTNGAEKEEAEATV